MIYECGNKLLLYNYFLLMDEIFLKIRFIWGNVKKFKVEMIGDNGYWVFGFKYFLRRVYFKKGGF